VLFLGAAQYYNYYTREVSGAWPHYTVEESNAAIKLQVRLGVPYGRQTLPNIPINLSNLLHATAANYPE
jgi:hypothetical protein